MSFSNKVLMSPEVLYRGMVEWQMALCKRNELPNIHLTLNYRHQCN